MSCKSHAAQIKQKRLSNLRANSGGRPQVLTYVDKRVCVKVATLRNIDVAIHVPQHVRRECQVIVSVDTMRRTLHAIGLRLKKK